MLRGRATELSWHPFSRGREQGAFDWVDTIGLSQLRPKGVAWVETTREIFKRLCLLHKTFTTCRRHVHIDIIVQVDTPKY